MKEGEKEPFIFPFFQKAPPRHHLASRRSRARRTALRDGWLFHAHSRLLLCHSDWGIFAGFCPLAGMIPGDPLLVCAPLPLSNPALIHASRNQEDWPVWYKGSFKAIKFYEAIWNGLSCCIYKLLYEFSLHNLHSSFTAGHYHTMLSIFSETSTPVYNSKWSTHACTFCTVCNGAVWKFLDMANKSELSTTHNAAMTFCVFSYMSSVRTRKCSEYK